MKFAFTPTEPFPGSARTIANGPVHGSPPSDRIQTGHAIIGTVFAEGPDDSVRLSLIAPCYNEEDALPAFFQAVIPALESATAGRWCVICVDDGSRDRTFEIIAQQHAIDPRVTGIRLSRNFGHQPAVAVGLAYATGAYVGVIDADLQDPIDVLIALYRKAVDEKLDVCFGIRGRRDAPLLLRVAYSLFYRIIDRLADHEWPRDTGDFCVISSRCHKVMLSLPEHSRMMRGLRAWVGFRQAGVSYSRPARLYGETKYNFRRLCALAMQGMVAFSSIPLRIATLIGLMMTGFSVLFGLLVLINRFVPRFTILGYWVGANAGVSSILVFGAFITSMMFLCIGIIGEYLIVMFQELKRRPTAVVGELLGSIHKNELAGHINAEGATVVRGDRAKWTDVR
jgi:glycosyltransferase involved in cell wall biosynthesis